MRRSGLAAVCAAVGILGAAAAWAGIDVRASHGARVTGDEPQYLVTAISLWDDHDLDVRDEIRDERFRPFHEIPLDPQTRPLEDGSEISPHDPLLPLLLAAPMRVGGWWAARATLAVMAGGLSALMTWTAVVRFGAPTVWAAITVGIFAASAPFAVYGTQVYPELPAALAVAGFIAVATGSLRATAVAAAVEAVILLPWLSIKYVPVAAVLAIALLLRLRRAGRSPIAWGVVVALVIAGVLYAWAHWAWYGGWTVYATGDHFVTGEFGVVGRDPDYLGRSSRLIGLLVDRTFGLVAWQPAWLLAIPAAVAMVRTKARPAGLLIAIAVAGWLNATFVALTMHGWWWPGRQVVVILPAVVLAIVWWTGRYPPARIALVGAGVWGVVTYGWIVVEGLDDRLTWVVDFATTRNPLYRGLRMLLPDYMNVGDATWVLHGAWMAAAAALGWWGWISVRTRSAPGSGPAEPTAPARQPQPISR